MKNLSLIVTTVLLLTGCASLQEAYYIDREFGQHSQAAWDQQIAYPDYRYAATTPETMEGITVENVMDVYNETFAEEPQDFEVIQFGLQN